MRISGTNLTKIKTALTTFPLRLKIRIQYTNNNTTTYLYEDNIVYLNYFYDGDILKSCMQGLIIESKIEIPKDTPIILYIGMYTSSSTVTYMTYGTFYITEVEKKEDNKSYLLTCYDAMIKTMKDYETPKVYTLTSDTTFTQDKDYYTYSSDTYTIYDGERTGNPNTLGLYEYGEITYPITLINYYKAICSYLGLNTSVSSFPNSSKTIPYDLYTNIGYTFRDVFDEISQASGRSICISAESNNVQFKNIYNGGDTINEDYLNENHVSIGEKYGPINSIVLSRSAESDNVYYKDDTSIAQNGLCELKICDNQIMNRNDRDQYLQSIANSIFGTTYYECDYSSSPQGIFYYNFLDAYTISIGETTYPCLMLHDNITISQGGITEDIYAPIPKTSKTDYKKADTTDQRINQALLEVDKANQRINAKVSKDNMIAELNVAIENGQGVIRAKGNTFILEADNCKIDQYGNTEFNNGLFRGGRLILEDDGDTASIQIKEVNTDDKTHLIVGADVQGKQILLDFKGLSESTLNYYSPLGAQPVYFENGVLYCLNEQYTQGVTDHFEVLLDHYTRGMISVNYYYYDENNLLMDSPIIDIPDDMGLITGISEVQNNTIFQLGEVKLRNTYYKGTGIIGEIYPKEAYTINDEDIVNGIVDYGTTPTQEQLEKYDFDEDGEITWDDYNMVCELADTPIDYLHPSNFQIDYKNPYKIIAINSDTKEYFRLGLLETLINTNLLIGDSTTSHDIKLNGTSLKDMFMRKPVVLYSSNGGGGNYGYTISLSDNIANYKFVEIIFQDGDGIHNSMKAYTKSQSSVDVLLMTAYHSNGYYLWQRVGMYTLSGSTLTQNGIKLMRTSEAPSLDYVNAANQSIGIKEVIGYYE